MYIYNLQTYICRRIKELVLLTNMLCFIIDDGFSSRVIDEMVFAGD